MQAEAEFVDRLAGLVEEAGVLLDKINDQLQHIEQQKLEDVWDASPPPSFVLSDETERAFLQRQRSIEQQLDDLDSERRVYRRNVAAGMLDRQQPPSREDDLDQRQEAMRRRADEQHKEDEQYQKQLAAQDAYEQEQQRQYQDWLKQQYPP